jgi:hypothetical protein
MAASMLKCPQCGAPNPNGQTNCYNCKADLPASQNVAAIQSSPTPGSLPAKPKFGQRQSYTNVLLSIAIGLLLCFFLALHSRSYEYKVITIESQRNEYGEGTIALTEASMVDLGQHGWELVGAVDDVETSFPNFGDTEYHTGIKSNTHTKSVHLLFKRSHWLFGLI